MKLYKFEKGHKFLDQIVPRIDEYEKTPIEPLSKQIKLSDRENIEFIEPWGIVLKENNIKRIGYVYDKYYRVSHYNRMPVFHLFKCKVINDFINWGKFYDYYYWSNTEMVTVIDRETEEKYNNVKLKLCSYCDQLLNEQIGNTKEFRKKTLQKVLEENDKQIENGNYIKDTDINGYPVNWKTISGAHKEIKNYTCEQCGFSKNDLIDEKHKKYIDVHHIDGNKLNTHTKNLQVLCKLCHSFQNEHHQSNFEKPRMKRELMNFVRKYKEKLIEIGNPYIETFINEYGNEI